MIVALIRKKHFSKNLILIGQKFISNQVSFREKGHNYFVSYKSDNND